MTTRIIGCLCIRITYNFAIGTEDGGVLSHWWTAGHKSHSFPLSLCFDLWNDDISSREIPHLATALTYNHMQQNDRSPITCHFKRLKKLSLLNNKFFIIFFMLKEEICPRHIHISFLSYVRWKNPSALMQTQPDPDHLGYVY